MVYPHPTKHDLKLYRKEHLKIPNNFDVKFVSLFEFMEDRREALSVVIKSNLSSARDFEGLLKLVDDDDFAFILDKYPLILNRNAELITEIMTKILTTPERKRLFLPIFIQNLRKTTHNVDLLSLMKEFSQEAVLLLASEYPNNPQLVIELIYELSEYYMDIKNELEQWYRKCDNDAQKELLLDMLLATGFKYSPPLSKDHSGFLQMLRAGLTGMNELFSKLNVKYFKNLNKMQKLRFNSLLVGSLQSSGEIFMDWYLNTDFLTRNDLLARLRRCSDTAIVGEWIAEYLSKVNVVVSPRSVRSSKELVQRLHLLILATLALPQQQLNLLPKYLLLCNHNIFNNAFGTGYWRKLCNNCGIDPISLDISIPDLHFLIHLLGPSSRFGQNSVRSKILIGQGTNEINCLTLNIPLMGSLKSIAKVNPTLFLPELSEISSKLIHDVMNLGLKDSDYAIYRLPEGELLISPEQKGPKSLLSKEERWEAELKKELSERGKIVRTKAQQEAYGQRLQIENERRELVKLSKGMIETYLTLMYVILESIEELNTLDFLLPYIEILNRSNLELIRMEFTLGREPLLGDASLNCFKQFGTLLLKQVDPSITAYSVLYSEIITLPLHLIPARLHSTEVSLRTIFGQCEQLHHGKLLAPTAFVYIFPIFKNIVVQNRKTIFAMVGDKVGIDLIASCCKILSNHVELFGHGKCLPYLDMFSCFISMIKDFPNLQETAGNAMIEAAIALGKDFLAGDVTEIFVGKAIDLLLGSVISNIDALRKTCLNALLELPTIEEKMSKLRCLGWILQFDEVNEIAALATKFWEESLYTDFSKDLILEVLQFSLVKEEKIRNASALASAEILTNNKSVVIDCLEFLYNRYELLIQKPSPEFDMYGMPIPESLNKPDEWEARIGISSVLSACVPILQSEATIISVLTFLLDAKAVADRNSIVRQEMLSVGLNLIKNKNSQKFLNTLLDFLEARIPKFDADPSYEGVTKEAAILLFGTAQYLGGNDSRVSNTIEKLLEMLKTPSESTQILVAECLAPLITLDTRTVDQYIQKMLQTLLTTENYGEQRGCAYGLAGIVKGVGISALKDHLIMAHLEDAIKDKNNVKRRQGAIFAYETLSFTLGRMFEPFVVSILPQLLVCFGDTNISIREATEYACKTIMSKISAQCIKMLLPHLLAALEERSYRSKVAAIDVIKSMSSLAPKQLSQSLPIVIPKICDTLGDSHQKVQIAAKAALGEFGKVIKNPEIQILIPAILDALVNPNQKTHVALKLLLETRFIHFIDSPSLALLVPIIHRGMRERSAEVKRKSAEIIGNMSQMTEANDLIPYLTSIMPELKEVLIDPVPETRATAATSFGILVGKLGEEQFPGLVNEFLDLLKSDISSVDRSGAAQGLSEILAALGVDRLRGLMGMIIVSANSMDPICREGFTILLTYLPKTFGDKFSPFIPQVIPTLLESLADDYEQVREVGLQLGQIIVKNYSSSAISLLLPALENGLFSDSWRIRQHSAQLIGNLIYECAGIKGQIGGGDDVVDDDNESAGIEQSRAALKSALGEKYESLLASLFIIRFDSSGLVRQVALQVWKSVVTNTQRILKQILQPLMKMLLGGLATEAVEMQGMCARTLAELLRRMGENIFDVVGPILTKGMLEGDEVTRKGVCIGLIEIIKSGERPLEEISYQYISLVKLALLDQSPAVRAAAAQTFDLLFGVLGNKVVDMIIPDFLSILSTNPLALEGLKDIMALRSRNIFPVLLPTFLARPISSINANSLKSLIEVSGSALNPRLDSIIHVLVEEVNLNTEAGVDITDTLLAIMKSTNGEGIVSIIRIMTELFLSKQNSEMVLACRLLTVLFAENPQTSDEISNILVEKLLCCFSSDNSSLVEHSWAAFNSLVSRSGNNILKLNHSVCRGIRLAAEETRSDIAGFNLPKGLKPVLAVVLTGLTSSSPPERETSAEAVCYLIKKTSIDGLKIYVTQITGSLIRIAGDRLSPEAKISVLEAIGCLLEKVPASLKPFLPQLQRTFVKSLSEPGHTIAQRTTTMRCLAYLIPLIPRLDPLVAELVGGIKLNEDYGIILALWGAVDAVLKASRECPKSAVSASSLHAIKSLVFENLKGGENDSDRRECAANCFATITASLENEDTSVIIKDLFHSTDLNVWTEHHGMILALQKIIPHCSHLYQDSSITSNIHEAIKLGLVAIKAPLVDASVHLAGSLMISDILTSEMLELLIPMCLPSVQFVDARREAIIYIKKLAKCNQSRLNAYLGEIVSTLLQSVRDRTIAIKIASERALYHVLQINETDSNLDEYLSTLDAMTAKSVGEYCKRVLIKLADSDED